MKTHIFSIAVLTQSLGVGCISPETHEFQQAHRFLQSAESDTKLARDRILEANKLRKAIGQLHTEKRKQPFGVQESYSLSEVINHQTLTSVDVSPFFTKRHTKGLDTGSNLTERFICWVMVSFGYWLKSKN